MTDVILLHRMVRTFQNELNTTEKERWIVSRPFVVRFNTLMKLVISEFPGAEEYCHEIRPPDIIREQPISAIGRFSEVRLQTSSLLDFLESKLDKAEELIGDVLAVLTLKLRSTIRKEPIDEKEVQEKVDTILNVSNFAYLREKRSIPYSSKHYIPDFTFDAENTCLEIKLCNRANKEKKIVDEINADIVAYKTVYEKLIFVVYDVGLIRDVSRFKEDIKDQEGVYIEVIKH